MKKIIIVTFLLFINLLNGQSLLKGFVKSSNSGKILAYVNINIVEKSVGTITNEEGRFEINIRKKHHSDSLKISMLGYASQTFLVKDFIDKINSEDVIFLQESLVELDEVMISNKVLSVEEIIEKVKENATKNYAITNGKRQIFHRATYSNTYKNFDVNLKNSVLIKKKERKKMNKSIDSLIKEKINATSTNYEDILSELYNIQENYKINIIKATKLINKKKDYSQDRMQKLFLNTIAKYLSREHSYKVKTGFFKIEDSLSIQNEFKADTTHKASTLKLGYAKILRDYSITKRSKLDFIFKSHRYNYKLKNISYQDANFIYAITFSPKRSSAKYEGVFYVSSDSFALIRAKFHFAKDKVGGKLNLKFLLGIKILEDYWESDVIYKKNGAGTFELWFIKQKVGTYIYLNRPIKYIKNRNDQFDGKEKLRFNFLMEYNELESDELFFVKKEELLKKDFETLVEKEEYQMENILRYSSEMWDDYNILSPVEAIKNYKTSN